MQQLQAGEEGGLNSENWQEIRACCEDEAAFERLRAILTRVISAQRSEHLLDRALQQSEERNRALLNAIPDLMFRIHRDGTYLSVKADREDDLAFAAAELLGKTVYEVLPAEIAQQRMGYVNRALETGTMQIFEYQLENRGQLRSYEARLVVSGQDEVLAIVRDVTARKQADAQLQAYAQQQADLCRQVQSLNATLEQQVQERTAQLEQNMQAIQELSEIKEEFLHTVSHDLRTPIMGMLLVLKNLQDKPGDPVRVSRAVLTRMIQSCYRQLNLISSLLEAHTSDIKGITLYPATFRLDTLTENIVADMEPLLQEHEATLINQVAANLPAIVADPEQLRRVYENLLTNALQHNPPKLILTLTAEVLPTEELTSPQWMRCTVQDNGTGLTVDESQSLFDRYVRGKHIRSSGLGLGLYLCRQIITAHGGEIGIISSPGSGATFWFTLPIATEVN